MPFDALMPLAFIAAAIIVSFFIENYYIRVAAFAVLVVLAIICFAVIERRARNNNQELADKLINDHAESLAGYVNTLSIPTAITDVSGKILWYNPALFKLAGTNCEGNNIFKIFEALGKPAKDKIVTIREKAYIRESIHSGLNGSDYVIYRFIDRDETVRTADLCDTVLSTVCHIQVDNYDDLRSSMGQGAHVRIDSKITEIVAAHAKALKAVHLRYDRDKYVCIFERRYLDAFSKGDFSILSEMRGLDTGIPALYPTLSIGIGIGQAPDLANKNALKALETALGRGGDQAVMKNDEGYKFYGGIQRGLEKRARTKVRMFSAALKNLMEQCSRVIIMGHTAPDMDCFGSALGISACARYIDKDAYIVIDHANPSIQNLTEELRKDPDYEKSIIFSHDAYAMMDEKTLLVIVDSLAKNYLQAPNLLRNSPVTAVIDHHVRGTGHIEDPTLLLHEPYASSAAEMVAEVIQYFADNIALKPIEAEALLSGITLDTKGFSFKTGVRTFEAAAFLRLMGADTMRIRQLFQDDLETFVARSKVAEKAHVTASGIAIAVCPADIRKPQLLAAQAADSLAGIRGVSSSFVLCEENGVIMISGRSLGSTNVQRILEKLGGGGHATIAGAQIHGKSMDEALHDLDAAIKEYENEVQQ